MAKLNADDEVVFFDECYHRSREFCTKTPVAIRRDDASGAGLRLRGNGSRHHAPHSIAGQRIAHQSAFERGRHRAVCGALAKRHGVETLIDATLGTPYNIRPLGAGVDYVLHSATKYLGGHNDLLAGVIVGSAEKLEPIRKLRGILGGINSPHNIYLLSVA